MRRVAAAFPRLGGVRPTLAAPAVRDNGSLARGVRRVRRKAGRRSESRRQAGFTLVAVIAIMAVMAIMLTVAVQTASFSVRREKEDELLFRGDQIVEGIRLFRARNGRFPNSLIELAKADPHVLRKAWSDPITGRKDWVPIFLGQEGTTALTGGVAPTPPGGAGSPFAPPTPTPTPNPGSTAFPATTAVGPLVGVHSRSCAQSIKVVDGRDRYCDWKFIFDPRKLQLKGAPLASAGHPPATFP
jgi:type II secretory pathway pseudopilin PulG